MVHRKPALSVVIASYNAELTIHACLSSLRTQETGEDFEVIVIDSSTDRTAELVKEEFPKVILYHFEDRKYCGDARNVGVSVARGDIIAFTDADCCATQMWVEEILKAHRSSHLAIGGAIGNAQPSGSVGWAAYFCEFTRWIPGTKARCLDDIAGANMSYKKTVFDTYGSLMEGTYCSDSEFHWRLGRCGHRLRFVPQIVVSHRSIASLEEFLRHEFVHGSCFARVRASVEAFSRLRRLEYVLLSPLIPLKILLKVLSNNLRNRVYLTHLLKASPLVFLGIVSWSVGEVFGYAGWRRLETTESNCPAG